MAQCQRAILFSKCNFFQSKENLTGGQREHTLESKPLLVVLPRGPCVSLTCSKRSQFWQSQLGSIGRCIQMNMLDVEKPEDFAASSFLESVMGGARTKISLVRVAILLLLLTI